MRHSTKMGIISLIISLISVVSWSYITYLAVVEGQVSVYLLLFIAVIFVAALFGPGFNRHGIQHIIKKARRLQPQIKFCFFCGTALPPDSPPGGCPVCNSNLNLVEIIDN